jgi:hypothetical protein
MSEENVIPIQNPIPTDTTPIRKGRPDPHGDTVAKIYLSTDAFVIYTVEASAGDFGRLRHHIPHPYQDAKGLRERLSPIVGPIAVINDVVCGLRGGRSPERKADARWEALRERTLDLQARAMQLAFEDQAQLAINLLDGVRGEVENRRDSRNRMFYIFANVAALVGILAIWILFGKFGVPSFLGLLVEPISIGAGTFRPIDVLALGALGAFFSVSFGVNAVRVNHSITMSEMLYAGFVRIPIGVISAVVAVMLIKGGWVLATIQSSYMVWTVYLFGFLAGFSELFVPNALKQVETSASVRAPGAPGARRS